MFDVQSKSAVTVKNHTQVFNTGCDKDRFVINSNIQISRYRPGAGKDSKHSFFRG